MQNMRQRIIQVCFRLDQAFIETAEGSTLKSLPLYDATFYNNVAKQRAEHWLSGSLPKHEAKY